MKRREFLKSVTALAAGSVLPAAPAIWSPAKAQSRQETLLIVSESGPNNLDIHGVGTNVPGYEVSWNCYDRLISHEMKTLPNGVQYYAVDHSPSYLWNSATWEISEALLPHLETVLAGPAAWNANLTISRAIEIHDGAVLNPGILSFQHRDDAYPHGVRAVAAAMP